MTDNVKKNELANADSFDRNDWIIQIMADNLLIKQKYKVRLKNFTLIHI